MRIFVVCMCTWIILPLLLWSLPHVGHLAEYAYTSDGDRLRLTFSVEHAELRGLELVPGCDVEKTTALCVARYLQQHTSIAINGVQADMQLSGSAIKDGYLFVYMETSFQADVVREIDIRNTCFREPEGVFRNRVIVDIAPFHKSFLLTKEAEHINLN